MLKTERNTPEPLKIKVGKRYRIAGPTLRTGIYRVRFISPDNPDYFSADWSPRPAYVTRRGGFGDHLSNLLATGHTITPVKERKPCPSN